MPSKSVFRWLDGRGWLVLSGGGDGASEIRAQALGRLAADGGVAYIPLSGNLETAEAVLEDMLDLGAPSGYLVDVSAEDDATITAKLADAGIIVIEASASAAEARSALLGAAVEGIQAAYEHGAVILAEGLSAMAFGDWLVKDDGTVMPGLEWLDGALIAPGVTNAAAWARELLLEYPLVFVVGIGASSALALGPDGQLEAWGDGEITVALGRSYASNPEEPE